MPKWALLRGKLAGMSLREHLLSAGMVLSLTASGFLLPGLLLDPGLKGYVSTASVKVSNPRAATSGVERMALQLRENLLSPMALGLMVSDMKLQSQDLTGAQTPGHMAVLLDLLAGGGQDGTPVVGATETALKSAVTLSPEPSRSEIGIEVTAANAQAAQRIADYLALRVVKEIGAERHDPQLQAVEAARVALDSAEAALTGFQMRHGNDAVSRIQSLQQKIREDEAETTSLAASQRELSDALASASSMKLDDVLSRNLPPVAAFAPLETIRQNYTAAKLALAEISVDHGPKHPRTIAAQATLDAARATAMPALRRVRATLAQEQAGVQASLDAHASTRADLDGQLQAMGDAPSDLARLEAALGKARSDYILSSQAAGTFSPVPRVSAALAQAAEPGMPNYDSFTANSMAVAGGVAGLLLSLLVLSFRRKDEEEVEIAQAEMLEPVAVVTEAPVEPHAAPAIEIEPAIFEGVDATEETLEPVAEMPAHVEDAAGITREHQLDVVDEFDEPANDVPLDQRVRQVLMRNAVPAPREENSPPAFKLPPLLAAALAGQASHPQAETEELRALRQELVVLRERLSRLAEEERANYRA